MLETYIIYNSLTGKIISSARLDRERDNKERDGSTTLEYVERQLAKHPDYDVLYLPDQPLPDPALDCVDNLKLRKYTQEELNENAKPTEEELLEGAIRDKLREMALSEINKKGGV